MLQQRLPFTVLKRIIVFFIIRNIFIVATALTVYGIETCSSRVILFVPFVLQQRLPFTVLKPNKRFLFSSLLIHVATALTVYGIET